MFNSVLVLETRFPLLFKDLEGKSILFGGFCILLGGESIPGGGESILHGGGYPQGYTRGHRILFGGSGREYHVFQGFSGAPSHTFWGNAKKRIIISMLRILIAYFLGASINTLFLVYGYAYLKHCSSMRTVLPLMTQPKHLRPYERTLDAKPNDLSIVKPGELIEVKEMTPLTLGDRRIFNLLISNAWDELDQPVQHAIAKRELQNTLHKGTERVGDSIARLMAAVVMVRVKDANGKMGTKRIQLLGPNTEPDSDDGMVRYEFWPGLRDIFEQSTNFARLQKQILFALSSKYSLALYEMIQKRVNLSRTFEDFTMEEFRDFLHVPAGKLTSWINFKNKAITPAVKEVTELSDFQVTVEPIKGKAKSFTGVRLSWVRKEPDGIKAVERELTFSKIGRKARLKGAVDSVDFGQQETNLPSLPTEAFNKARKLCPGYDVYYVESKWREWAADKPRPVSLEAAFLGFCKTFPKNNPL